MKKPALLTINEYRAQHIMKVKHHTRGVYYLLKDQDQHLINVNSGRGAVGFSISVELNKEQEAAYLSRGESYLVELAEHIHQNQVTYFECEISKDRREAMHTAIMQWLKDNGIDYTNS